MRNAILAPVDFSLNPQMSPSGPRAGGDRMQAVACGALRVAGKRGSLEHAHDPSRLMPRPGRALLRLTRRMWRPGVRLVASALLMAGSAVAQAPAGGVRPVPGAMARVAGVVFDSVAMRPLGGALVQLVDGATPAIIRTNRTNDDGRFAFDSVPRGTYLLGFLHSRLDSLGLESPLLRVELQSAGELDAALTIPSFRSIRAKLCGDAATAGDAMFIGSVRRASGLMLERPARIRVQWTELQVSGDAVGRQTMSRYATTSESGAFALCVPGGAPLTTRAFGAADSSGFVELTVTRDGLLLRDIYIGSNRTPSATSAPNASGGTLRGTVKDASGRPVPSARLALRGTDVTGTAGSSGEFTLVRAPTGTYVLESRALGFQPAQLVVDIVEDRDQPVHLVVAAAVPLVDTLRVRASRGSGAFSLGDFERRRKSAFGHFIDEGQLAARAPRQMADIFRATPGMTIMPGPAGADRVLMRSSGGGGSCVPAVFLNGVTVTSGNGQLENLVQAADVRAVEVYSRTASMPVQFDMRNGCGSIVIWTGPRAAPSSRK